tara:strand:+ start:1141 stop:1437 length:297 start_codon:yes stop_codon:yes gene_type:complete
MKTFKQHNEGLFGKKKSKEDIELEKMRDEIQQMSQKAGGKGRWSAGDQEKYNKLWIDYKKKTGNAPKGMKPSVFMEPGMSVYKHADLVKALHKKLGIK